MRADIVRFSRSSTAAIGLLVRRVGPLLGLAAAVGTARAQSPASTGDTVRGVVLSTDAAPVAGATVTLARPERVPATAVTGADGRFGFVVPEPGAATLRVRRIGFRAESLAVTLPAPPGTNFTVRLTTVAQALAPVVVRAGRREMRRPGPLADFYHRQASGQGHYVTRADIERRNPLYTTDLLRMVPGIAISRSRGPTELRLRGASCAPEIFLDGTELGPAPLDFDAITPNTIEGIEIYSAATVPVAFTRGFGRSACGTVLLWTREGEPAPPRHKGKPVTSEDLARLVEELQLFTAEQVDSVARPTGNIAATVALPDSVEIGPAGTGVIAEFVVDAAGRVEPATINVVATPGPRFSDAVRAALPGAHFTPAWRGGHPVRQLVQLSVRFDPPAARR